VLIPKIKTVHHVVARRLCLGCGVCSYICPKKQIKLIDVEDDGIRPIAPENCRNCRQCLEVCPGIHTVVASIALDKFREEYVISNRWGRILEVWEGYATDSEIRFKGSSGGLCSALSIFCIEKGLASGVLHIGADPERPWQNKTFRSTTKEEISSKTGSRYSPASPCDRLDFIENAKGHSVFIGKPCDVVGFRMACQKKPKLVEKSALTIGFFCAGSPSTRGTLALFKRHSVEPFQVADLRYRGMGWPGVAQVQYKDRLRCPLKLTYSESWGFVQKYRPFRCYLCPDLTAELADISVGDPWYRDVGEAEPGRSLIVIRTQLGREVFRQAVKEKYIAVEPAALEIIYRSQKNLLAKRQAIWGRLLAMRLLGIPYPQLEGYQLYMNWMDLPFKEKIKSVLGTARRIIKRNYLKPLEFECIDGTWQTKK
jgi:coenzyme F420 hydrogenase subunit beta